MTFKKGAGWKACYDSSNGRYFGEFGGVQEYRLMEITKEIFDRLDKKMRESEASDLMCEGRRMYMSVNDRSGPPYTIVFDDDYEKLCPWADVVKTEAVWSDELTDAVVEVLESEKDNREQRRQKREQRDKE